MARGERLSEQQQHQLISLAAQVDGAWKIIQAQTYQPDTPQELREAVEIADKHYFGDLRDKRGQIIEALSRGTPPPFSTREWLAMSHAGPGQHVSSGRDGFDPRAHRCGRAA